MVVDQLSDEAVDRLFQAFADATRRDIMRRVTVEEYSISRLAGLYAMSFAAVQKHVAVLERASLVTKEKRGREQIVRADHEGLQKVRRLLDEYEVMWRQRSERIADLLAEGAPPHSAPQAPAKENQRSRRIGRTRYDSHQFNQEP